MPHDPVLPQHADRKGPLMGAARRFGWGRTGCHLPTSGGTSWTGRYCGSNPRPSARSRTGEWGPTHWPSKRSGTVKSVCPVASRNARRAISAQAAWITAARRSGVSRYRHRTVMVENLADSSVESTWSSVSRHRCAALAAQHSVEVCAPMMTGSGFVQSPTAASPERATLRPQALDGPSAW